MSTLKADEQSAPFRVGNCDVDPASGRLFRDGQEIKIEPKVMDVLVYLARHPGQVISRESLEKSAWEGTVVGYNALAGSIIKLRKALGDDSRSPTYIETVSKKGYRLIAPVRNGAQDPYPSSTATGLATDSIQGSPAPGLKRRIAAGIVVTCALIGAFFYLYTGSTPSPVPAPPPAVVVLPFKNLSGDPAQEHLSDGITDDLITDLSRQKSLRVIAPQSAYHYKDNPAGLNDIARHLGVLYIVEGSLRKLGTDIRINVQLTNTKKGVTTWAERFDTNTNDIFKVQDHIAINVLAAMTAATTAAQTAQTRGTEIFAAYDAFLLGQQHVKARSRTGYEYAMKAYRRAIELDPKYARAYGAMAVTLTRGYRYQWADLAPVDARERALVLANKAVELDGATPQIYWSLGYVRLHRREYDEAETAVRKSITLSPNYADGYALLANIANWRGKASDAAEYIKRATVLNPYYSFQYPSTLGTAYYNLGRYKDAVDTLNEAVIRNENAISPRLYLAAAYAHLGMEGEAAWELEQIKTNRPDVDFSKLRTMLPYERPDLLNNLLADLRRAGLEK